MGYREKISAEYEAYKKTVNDWSKLKEQEINATKEQINQTFRQADHKLKHEFHKMEHTMHAHLQRTQALLDAMNKKLGAVQS